MRRRQLPALALGALLIAAAALAAPVEVPETLRWMSAAGEVVFAHQRHAEEYGAECVSCHHETVAANLAVPHPDYFDGFWVDCKSCHTGSTTPAVEGKCSNCHPDRVAGLNLEMPTVKVAIHRSCWGCHDRGTGSEASKQCGFCHQRPEPPRATPAGEAATK